MPVIPPISSIASEFSIAPINSSVTATAPSAGGSGGFGSMIAHQLNQLGDLQTQAAQASRSLADGTATDPSSVVTAVERAQLSMQLASQLRTKATDAINTIFQTQV
jgi:flagellar hook-basal body complex protein FliE